MSATTTPLPVEKGNAFPAFISCIAGCCLYQSGAAVPGTFNTPGRLKGGKRTPVFSSIHWIPSTVALAGNGTTGKFSKRSEEHTSELQSRFDLVCRLLLEK